MVRMLDEAQSESAAAYSTELADAYPNIWDSVESLVDSARSEAETWAVEKVRVPVSAARYPTIGLFCVGLTLFIISMANGEEPGDPYVSLWLIVTLFFIFLCVGYYKNAEKLEAETTQRRIATAEFIIRTFLTRIDERRHTARNHTPPADGGTAATARKPRSPAPQPPPYGVSPQGAEEIVAVWMQHLGEDDAATTQYSGDGGVDVTSLHYIGQVERTPAPSASERCRRASPASPASTVAVRCSSPAGQYARGAIQFADNAGIALFRYDVHHGELVGVNLRGNHAMENGL